VAGFFLVPALGYAGSLRASVLTNLVLAALALGLWCRASRGLLVFSTALTLAALLLYHPSAPLRLLKTSALTSDSSSGRVVFEAVGRSASVIMLEIEGTYEIRSNGLPEAVIEPKGAPPFGRNTTWWLSALPVIARPAAESMLVIGLGGGVTLEMVPPGIKSLDVIELEPEVIEANRRVAPLRAIDPLVDPRLVMHQGDARGALALTNERWDVIVSQPSHPWTAGASHLYTREFLGLVREHLEPGGVFVQWMHVGFLDEGLLRTLARTVIDAFPHARLYRPIPMMLVFLASDSPLAPEIELARTGEPLGSAPAHFARQGLSSVNDLVALLALDQDGLNTLAAGAAVNTDDDNRLALSRPAPERILSEERLAEIFKPIDPITDPESPLSKGIELQLDRLYLARRLFNLQHMRRAAEVMQTMTNKSDRALAAAVMANIIQMQKPDGSGLYSPPDLWQLALERDPRNVRAQYEGLAAFMGAISRSEAPAGLLSSAARLTGMPGAVVRGARAIAEQNWSALHALEATLAQAVPTDPWYVKCAWLRARARIDGRTAEEVRATADETLQILDAALVLQLDAECLLARIDLGRAADRPEVFIESAAELGRATFLGALVFYGGEDARIRGMLTALLPELTALETDPRMRPERLAEVRASVVGGLPPSSGF
jgi:hypothetical protein